jgi:opacity protein-like surface antigen
MRATFVSRKLAAVSSILAIALILAAVPALGQQTYVTRFNAYGGYMFFNSPAIGLKEHGANFQFGVRANRWLTLGVDYSRAEGDMGLDSTVLTPELQQKLAALMPALPLYGIPVPAGYVLRVPTHSVSQTIAVGPELVYRRFKAVTIFARPNGGFIFEGASPRPADAISQFVVARFKAMGLVPLMSPKRDHVFFWGWGAGIDFNLSKRVSLRVQTDMVRDHLFDDLLANPRNTFRVAVGPAFNFGPNIIKR